jgi:hypothetical protein
MTTFQNAEDQDIQNNNVASCVVSCEMWYHTLREELNKSYPKTKCTGKPGPEKDEVNEQFRILQNEEVCDLYRRPNIVG